MRAPKAVGIFARRLVAVRIVLLEDAGKCIQRLWWPSSWPREPAPAFHEAWSLAVHSILHTQYRKLLDCAKRCVVHFCAAFQQAKTEAALLVRRLRIVPNDLQAAALGWPFPPESADDHTGSRLHRAGDLAGCTRDGRSAR